MRGPGRPRQYDDRIRVGLTNAQIRHLEFRALSISDRPDSIAAVIRHLIDKDMEELKAHAE